MLKKIISILVAAAILVPVGVQAAGETVPFTLSNDKLYVGLNQVTDPPFYKYEGTNYVPLRAVSESLGLSVDYSNNTITIDKGKPDIEKLKQSCVMVQTDKGSGSGVVIDYGKVLTCHHVMEGQHINRVTWNDGSTEDNLTIDKDVESVDTAVLKSNNKDIKPVKIGDSEDLKVGDKIYVISCPRGKENVVSEGRVVDNKGQTYVFDGRSEHVLETSAKVDLGSSGGAVFDSSGEVLGFIEGGEPSNNDSYIIPIDNIRKAIAD